MFKKKKIKTIKIKKATYSQLSTTESKKNKLSKQPEQEQNQRHGDHLEGYQLGGGEGEGKVQRINSINNRWKIDRGRVRIVWEMQKPKNL